MTQMQNYKIIDAHCHIYPDKIAQTASDSTSEFYSMPSRLDGKASTLIMRGEAAGIEHFVVQSVATSPKQVSSINNSSILPPFCRYLILAFCKIFLY